MSTNGTLVRNSLVGPPLNKYRPTLENSPTTPVIRPPRPKSFPAFIPSWQSMGSPAGRSPAQLPAPPLPRQPQTTLPVVKTSSPRRFHCIYFVPHVDSRHSLKFDPILCNIEEGNVPLRIGRTADHPGPNASGVLGSGALYFKSKAVSRAHAEIRVVTDGKFFVRDTKSSFGTFLNGVRLSPANLESRLAELKDGDVLQLGVDLLGGHEDTDKCVKMRVEINRKGLVTAKVYRFVPLSSPSADPSN